MARLAPLLEPCRCGCGEPLKKDSGSGAWGSEHVVRKEENIGQVQAFLGHPRAACTGFKMPVTKVTALWAPRSVVPEGRQSGASCDRKQGSKTKSQWPLKQQRRVGLLRVYLPGGCHKVRAPFPGCCKPHPGARLKGDRESLWGIGTAPRLTGV